MENPMWLLDDGIQLARSLESIAVDHGMHVAIGGGCLHRGMSQKDVDLFFYPRKTREGTKQTEFLKALGQLGFSEIELRRHEDYGDAKTVFKSCWNGKRVDLFFI